MEWRFFGNKPVYQQIIEQFRAAVLSGEYAPGSRVPSVRELAMQTGVNPNTVQRAFTELERQGLLVGCGTNGRRVTEQTEVLDDLRQQAVDKLLRTYALRMRELGLTVEQAAALLLEMEKEV